MEQSNRNGSEKLRVQFWMILLASVTGFREKTLQKDQMPPLNNSNPRGHSSQNKHSFLLCVPRIVLQSWIVVNLFGLMWPVELQGKQTLHSLPPNSHTITSVNNCVLFPILPSFIKPFWVNLHTQQCLSLNNSTQYGTQITVKSLNRVMQNM